MICEIALPAQSAGSAISQVFLRIVASQPVKAECEFSARGDFVVGNAGHPLDSGGLLLYPIMRIYG
jgi:hypothetical protein